MEEQDHDEEKLKLELPSLFGRRKRKAGAGTSQEPDAPRQPFDDEPEAAYDEVDEAELTDAEPTDAEPDEAGRDEPAADAPEPEGADADAPEPEVARPTRRFGRRGRTAAMVDSDAVDSDADSDAETDEGDWDYEEEHPLGRRGDRPQRHWPPVPTALGVGLFIGLLACGLTYLGMVGCREIQGTEACGGPGFFVLLAIVVMLVAVGGFLLKTFGVPEPTSTSLLAVGVVTVIALAFLIDVIFAWWMIIVIPLTSAVAYLASHWLTSRAAESETPADADEAADA